MSNKEYGRGALDRRWDTAMVGQHGYGTTPPGRFGRVWNNGAVSFVFAPETRGNFSIPGGGTLRIDEGFKEITPANVCRRPIRRATSTPGGCQV